MLDITDLVCPVLRTPFLESFMTVVGYYGHSATGIIIGAALLVHGHVYQNDRTKSAGIALLIVLVLIIGLAEGLKHGLQQQLDTRSHLNPSGRTGTAFGLASVLSLSFPSLSPFFFGLAILTAISRLYWHAQHTWNVLGGALVGLAVSWPIAKKLLPRGNLVPLSLVRFAGWMGILTVGLSALAFFYYAENRIAAHLVTANNVSAQDPTTVHFDFGTPQARTSLRYGWSGDESWNGGKRSVVWATGLASELVMNLPQQDYRFRFNVFPSAPKGPACQGIEIRLNGVVVTKVLLEPGWHWYEFDVPKTAIDNTSNYVQFFYDYAEAPASGGKRSDDRLLSVAFDSLQALRKR